MTKTIELTKGMITIVDDEDYEWLSQWRWNAHRSRSKWYATRMVKIDGVQRMLFMHRVINSTPDGWVTDHINRDSLDNRRSNLRSVTNSINQRNGPGMSKFSRHGYKGIAYKKRAGNWSIIITGFSTPEEAARSYDKAVRHLFGKHVYTNFDED